MRIILTLAFSGTLLILNAQDTFFSLFQFNTINLNPAHTGYEARYRSFYQNKNNFYSFFNNNSALPIVSQSASVDFFIDSLKSGFAFIYSKDNYFQSYSRNQEINAAYSFRFKTKKGQLVLASQLGLGFRNLDFSKLTFGDMIFDPNKPTEYIYYDGEYSNFPIEARTNFFDFALGGIFYNSLLKFGLVFHHINKPNVSYWKFDYNIPRKVTVHADFYLPLFNKSKNLEVQLSPSFLYQMQGSNYVIYTGSNLIFNNFRLGTFIRRQKSDLINRFSSDTGSRNFIGFSGGFQNKYFGLSYSYDFTSKTKTLNTLLFSQHEISLFVKIK